MSTIYKPEPYLISMGRTALSSYQPNLTTYILFYQAKPEPVVFSVFQ